MRPGFIDPQQVEGRRTAGLLETLADHHASISALLHRVAGTDEKRDLILGELIRQMAAHVSVEQTFLVPPLRRQDRGAASRVTAGFREMEHLLVRIERRKPNSPDQPDLVEALARAFRRHADLFDEVVEPNLRSALSETQLDDLGRKAASAHGVIVSHPHPTLLSLGPLSRITTRIAGHYDRIRDLLSGRREILGEQERPGPPHGG